MWQIVSELCKTVSELRMKLLLFYLQLLNNNAYHFPNSQKIFKNTNRIVVGLTQVLNSSRNHLRADL